MTAPGASSPHGGAPPFPYPYQPMPAPRKDADRVSCHRCQYRIQLDAYPTLPNGKRSPFCQSCTRKAQDRLLGKQQVAVSDIKRRAIRASWEVSK